MLTQTSDVATHALVHHTQPALAQFLNGCKGQRANKLAGGHGSGTGASEGEKDAGAAEGSVAGESVGLRVGRECGEADGLDVGM